MKLGIYGGTFSPVHNGHINAAKTFIEQCKLDKLLIIPAGIPPHKEVKGEVSPSQRLDMCRLGFSDISKAEVSDIELKRSGKSYTVMTVRELFSEDLELFLLCGTDMMMTFDAWYCFEEIMQKCTLVCIRRESDKDIGDKLEDKLNLYREKYSARIICLDTDAVEISSTEIREKIGKGRTVASEIPTKVLQYITENKLYTE